MAKADLKTKQTETSVEDFLSSIADEQTSADCQKLAAMMEKATGEKPKLWSSNIVGFGSYSYTYETGRTGDWFLTGFSPRKANLTIYFVDIESLDTDLLATLGKYKSGKGCLHFKKLSDIDEKVLEKLVEKFVENIKGK